MCEKNKEGCPKADAFTALRNWLAFFTSSLIQARENISSVFSVYKMGGKKYVREAINNALEYIILAYPECSQLTADIMGDLIKSPKFMEAMKVIKSSIKGFHTMLVEDPEILSTIREIEKLFTQQPIEAIGKDGLPIDHSIYIDPFEKGKMRSKEDIQGEYDRILAALKKKKQEDERTKRFAQILKACDGNVDKAYTEFEKTLVASSDLK